MECVWIIEEECHGFLAVAQSLEEAIKWLIKIKWIYEESEVWKEGLKKTISIKEDLGIDWENKLLEQNPEYFENMGFYLREEELV